MDLHTPLCAAHLYLHTRLLTTLPTISIYPRPRRFGVNARYGFPVAAERHIRWLQLHRSERHREQPNEWHAPIPNVVGSPKTRLHRGSSVALSDSIAAGPIRLPAKLLTYSLPDSAESAFQARSGSTTEDADGVPSAKSACASDVTHGFRAELPNAPGIRPKFWRAIPGSISVIGPIVAEPAKSTTRGAETVCDEASGRATESGSKQYSGATTPSCGGSGSWLRGATSRHAGKHDAVAAAEPAGSDTSVHQERGLVDGPAQATFQPSTSSRQSHDQSAATVLGCDEVQGLEIRDADELMA